MPLERRRSCIDWFTTRPATKALTNETQQTRKARTLTGEPTGDYPQKHGKDARDDQGLEGGKLLLRENKQGYTGFACLTRFI